MNTTAAAAAGLAGLSSHIVVQSTYSAELVAKEARGERLSARQRLFLLLNEPGSSAGALRLSRLMWLLMIAYAACIITQSIVWVTERSGGMPWLCCNIIFNVLYTVEAILRFAAYPTACESFKDPFFLLDLTTVIPFWLRLLIYPNSMTPDGYIITIERGMPMRVLEGFSSLRLLKMCRYYDGAALLARALSNALLQLGVPFFMLLIMLFCFACIMLEIEWDHDIESCMQWWIRQGVAREFLVERPRGVEWDCTVCHNGTIVDAPSGECEPGVPAAACTEQIYLCATCNGFPSGHPECAGLRFAQLFPDVPRTIWFMMVTVTTVGYGDAVPETWRGQLFASVVIVCGVVFLSMPLAIVGRAFNAEWDDREVQRMRMCKRV